VLVSLVVICNTAPVRQQEYDEEYATAAAGPSTAAVRPLAHVDDSKYETLSATPADNAPDAETSPTLPVAPTSPETGAKVVGADEAHKPIKPVANQNYTTSFKNTGEVMGAATCDSIEGQSHWKGALAFAAYKLKERMNQVNTTRKFVCEDVHVQILNTASLFIRGYLNGGQNKSLFVIQVVRKNPDVELVSDLPGNIPGEFETRRSDDKIKISAAKIAGSYGAHGDPEMATFAHILSRPKGE
jgi:hypothetical protein